MAVLSRPWGLAVLSRQTQPSGQTSRFEARITSSILARAISLSASEPSTKSEPNGRFIKAMAVLSRPWFYQGRSSGLQIPYYPAQSVYQRPGQAIFNSSFIKARSNGRFIKALAVLSRQKQPSGQTSRFQPRIASSILSFTISLSAAGQSHFQQKPAQWPFYQGRPARWPFYQGLA